ncbi:tRNA (adenosine(37)-N6)-dimethylallyltransferase MiaA [Luteimonas terrae]|uniref:tRNA dimethylallyltransferase n=1 Tax=Luteimonas terrae TaxID=1530191 RepID=A0A4R5UDQ3_9GAMM|nr:tRNA (adenosine(37)-N6)-dimethylallyltransferase MiaA [Luteimonas terrae]TDK33413.1 tRNA (adenosine(37)-N6)-dimethylallyltransferase MiaA [Luteimonas terrae]
MIEAERSRAIALMGPTASGKTALALDWAERFGGEIISVDSALVYRGLDIGAAKPDAAERARAPHHMLDLRDPWQTYSAAEFAHDARAAVDDILSRGRVPILAGGTGMYFAALLDGLSPMPEADADTRAAITAEAAERGWPALHAQLAQIDPEAAARIQPGDPQRIQRALEVHRLTGTPISEWQKRPSTSPPFPAQVLSLAIAPPERATLHARIAARFDAMLAAGFLDEVQDLRALPQLQAHPAPLDLPAIRAVGYRQAWEFLDGQGTETAFRERAIAATRQLAKRQFTWLRGRSGATWFDPATQRDALDTTVAGFLGAGDPRA